MTPSPSSSPTAYYAAETPEASGGAILRSEPMAAPFTLISPAANGLQTDPDALTFSWTPINGKVQWYRVRIETPKGKRLMTRTFKNVNAICADGLCSVTFADAKDGLQDGKRYKWQLIAKKQGKKDQVKTNKTRFVAAFTDETRTSVLPTLYEETFDSSALLPHWVYTSDSTLDSSVNPGYLAVTTNQLFSLPFSYVEDVTLYVRATLNTGGVALRVRGSGLGIYAATLNVNGQVTLYRDMTVLGTATITTEPGTTHDFSLSAIGGNLIVTVDGIEQINITDAVPLPYGILQIRSDYAGESDVQVEYVKVSATIAPEPLAGQDMILEQMSLSSTATFDGVNTDSTTSLTGEEFLYYQKFRFDAVLDSDIYRANPSLTGTNENEELVVKDATRPTLSPDMSRLAFISALDGSHRIWIKYLHDGTLVRATLPRILEDSNSDADSALSWSPDGNRLAFVRGNKTKIYVLDLRTRVVSAYNTARRPVDIAWRPSEGSETIAYSQSCTCIQKINALILGDTNEIQLAGDNTWHVYSPTWSPDGRFLTYLFQGDYLQKVEISEENTPLLSTNIRILAVGGIKHASWSPSGEFIAYVYNFGGYVGINFIDPDGNIQPNITQPYQIRDVHFDTDVSWGGTESNPVTIDRCISVSVPNGIPLYVGTPSTSLATATGTPLATSARLLLKGRLDETQGRWLRSDAYYPPAGQTPTPFPKAVWVRQTDFNIDACDDTINVHSEGYGDDVYYLPDLTFMTTTPMPTPTPIVQCHVLNNGPNNATVRSSPGGATTLTPSIGVDATAFVFGVTDMSTPAPGQTDPYFWYRLEDNWGGTGQTGWVAATGSLSLLGDNCDQLPVYNLQATPYPPTPPTATRTPSLTPTRGISPTPTLTPTYIMRETLVATQAVPFHREAAQFGLPAPFDQWPRSDPVRFQNGYGPNFTSNKDCNLATPSSNCQYSQTRMIHPGVDYYTPNEELSDLGDLVVAVCDGVIVQGRVDGGTAANNSEVDGLSLRCFANDPNDPDKDGDRNLSNIVVVYNHIWDPEATPYPGVTPQPIRKDTYQIVRKGQPIGHTSRYNTSSGNRVDAHLDLQIFLGRSYRNDLAIQINPLLMFQNDLVLRHNTPLATPPASQKSMLYPPCCNAWTLQGNGMTTHIEIEKTPQPLSYWKYPNNSVFIKDVASYLDSLYVLAIYYGPNCEGLPSNLLSEQLGVEPYDICAIDSDDTTFRPSPTPTP